MPRNEQLARQLYIMRRLESPRGVTLRELASALPDELPRHLRTIRRDLEAIETAGYPVLTWYSRAKWEERPEQPDEQYTNCRELEARFKWMLSRPESRLVVLVTFFQQQPAAERDLTIEKQLRRGQEETSR